MTAKTPDEQAVERWPIGRDAKLDELMVLVAMSAASKSGNGYDMGILKQEAARAAKLWDEHIAALAQPKVGDGEVREMVERLRRYVDAIERKDDGKKPPTLHVGPMMCANAMSEAADLLERLTSP